MKRKIYNSVVIDMATGETLSEDSYFYDGPMAMCGWWDDVQDVVSDVGEYFSEDVWTGKTDEETGEITDVGFGNVGDYLGDRFGEGAADWETGEEKEARARAGEARAKASEIAGKQLARADEQWAMYKEFFMPYEIEVAGAKREILPQVTATQKEFYEQALGGIDVERRADEAQTDVESAYKLGERGRRREISRYGMDPGSSVFANAANIAAIEKSKSIAGARTKARETGKTEQFNRLGYSLGRIGGVADPSDKAMQLYSGAASTYVPLASQVMQGQQQGGPGAGSVWGSVLGAGIGATYGGWQGAAVGSQVGGGVGGLLDS